MRRKNITSEMMKNFITESLLILMEQKLYANISIGEITDKAGVNRSTYYRNFSSKEDIIKHFFIEIIESYLNDVTPDISTEEYLTGMFHAFLEKKKQVMAVHNNRLDFILYETLNDYFMERVKQRINILSFEEQFTLFYHTGGIFNTLVLWFSNSMSPSPEELAKLSTQIAFPVLKST